MPLICYHFQVLSRMGVYPKLLDDSQLFLHFSSGHVQEQFYHKSNKFGKKFNRKFNRKYNTCGCTRPNHQRHCYNNDLAIPRGCHRHLHHLDHQYADGWENPEVWKVCPNAQNSRLQLLQLLCCLLFACDGICPFLQCSFPGRGVLWIFSHIIH